MKRQWKIHREMTEYPDGQKRWDRAYLLLLEIARSTEMNQTRTSPEVQHASSDLCQGVDPTSNTSPND